MGIQSFRLFLKGRSPKLVKVRTYDKRTREGERKGDESTRRGGGILCKADGTATRKGECVRNELSEGRSRRKERTRDGMFKTQRTGVGVAQ